MRKIIFIVCCMVLFSSAARAQEKTLHEVSEIILSHVEGTMICVAAGKECSEAEVLGLKADAMDDVLDVVLLVKSGNMNRMRLTNDQVMGLAARLGLLQSQFAHIAMFDTVCNLGILLLDYGAGIIHMGLVYFFPPLILLGLIMLPAGALLMLSCLFWWL